ncbi:MAG: GNAT family N-acetyltransferase [Defluviitaleaceae bacterium]|nr:GNAT family N-acetyltransferase [Defluviitaleaceae bacterium]
MVFPGFLVKPITRGNYADVWEVYESNPKYFGQTKGRAVQKADILDTFERLVPKYDAGKQFFAGLWCECDGRAAAVLELLPDFPNHGQMWLSEIIIRGDLHGTGLGSKIVQTVIEYAKQKGFGEIQLGIEADSVAFWQKQGFEQMPQDDDYLLFFMKLGD